MSHVPDIEDAIRQTIDLITDSSQSNDPFHGWEALHIGYDRITTEWERSADGIVAALIRLLASTDRRVVLLAITYLGMIQEDMGSSAVHVGAIRRAVGQIKEVALKTEDNNIAVAAGLANAILGDESSRQWMAREMAAKHISDGALFKRAARLGVVDQILAGWQ